MFRLDSKKIILLYQHFNVKRVEEESKKERVLWLAKCCEKEKYLGEIINKKLKTG